MSLLLALTAVAPPEPPTPTPGTKLGNRHDLFLRPPELPSDDDDALVLLLAA